MWWGLGFDGIGEEWCGWGRVIGVGVGVIWVCRLGCSGLGSFVVRKVGVGFGVRGCGEIGLGRMGWVWLGRVGCGGVWDMMGLGKSGVGGVG